MAKKILLIEDDEFLRKVMLRKLKAENYDAVEAIDGKNGLKVAKEEKPDLILLDLVLPEVDGFEVLAELKKDKKLSKIPVIILSNLGEQEEVKKGLKLGAVDYLIKANFTSGEIIKRIESVFK